jgi:hypothetical protein
MSVRAFDLRATAGLVLTFLAAVSTAASSTAAVWPTSVAAAQTLSSGRKPASAPWPTTPSFVYWNPVNREQPDGQWGQQVPSIGSKCAVDKDGSETYCGAFPGFFFGPTMRTLGLKDVGDATVAVSVYRSNTRAGVVALRPGEERCFDRTSLTDGYNIDAQSLSAGRAGVLEVTRVTQSGGGCGSQGLNMAFEPYRNADPQWGSSKAQPTPGAVCSSETAPLNGRDVNCGQLNSGNLGLSTGGIVLRNDSTLGRRSVRIVAYAPPLNNYFLDDPGSAIGSYVLAPREQHCFGFRGSGISRHTITLQRPPGMIGTKVSVVGISTTGSTCTDDGLNMVRGYSGKSPTWPY